MSFSSMLLGMGAMPYEHNSRLERSRSARVGSCSMAAYIRGRPVKCVMRSRSIASSERLASKPRKMMTLDPAIRYAPAIANCAQ